MKKKTKTFHDWKMICYVKINALINFFFFLIKEILTFNSLYTLKQFTSSKLTQNNTNSLISFGTVALLLEDRGYSYGALIY